MQHVEQTIVVPLKVEETFKICEFCDCFKYGNAFCDIKNVLQVLILCIKSYSFIRVSNVQVNEIADALLTKISIPSNSFTAASIHFSTDSSSLTSTINGRAFPPAFFISTIKS
jgi:hypothetical protein